MLRKTFEIILDISISFLLITVFVFMCIGFRTAEGISSIYLYTALMITMGIVIVSSIVGSIFVIHALFEKR